MSPQRRVSLWWWMLLLLGCSLSMAAMEEDTGDELSLEDILREEARLKGAPEMMDQELNFAKRRNKRSIVDFEDRKQRKKEFEYKTVDGQDVLSSSRVEDDYVRELLLTELEKAKEEKMRSMANRQQQQKERRKRSLQQKDVIQDLDFTGQQQQQQQFVFPESDRVSAIDGGQLFAVDQPSLQQQQTQPPPQQQQQLQQQQQPQQQQRQMQRQKEKLRSRMNKNNNSPSAGPLSNDDIRDVTKNSDLSQILNWLEAISQGREHDVTAALMVAKKKTNSNNNRHSNSPRQQQKQQQRMAGSTTTTTPSTTTPSVKTEKKSQSKLQSDRVESELTQGGQQANPQPKSNMKRIGKGKRKKKAKNEQLVDLVAEEEDSQEEEDSSESTMESTKVKKKDHRDKKKKEHHENMRG